MPYSTNVCLKNRRRTILFKCQSRNVNFRLIIRRSSERHVTDLTSFNDTSIIRYSAYTFVSDLSSY